MEIDLGKGLVAVIDDEDAGLVAGFTWYPMNSRGTIYPAGWKHMPPGRFFVHLHRLIVNAQPNQIVDHIDRDTLNCRRSNLRAATKGQNNWNRGPNLGLARGRTNRFKGVFYCRTHETFVVRIAYKGKRHYLGSFADEIKAARAYNAKAKELFGEFAYLNDVAGNG